MKDYTVTIKDEKLRKETQKNFILKYEIKDNKIGKKQMIIYFANGTKECIDYPTDLEKAILHLMKHQVIEYKPRMQEYERNYKEILDSLNLENKLGILFVSLIVITGMISTASFSALLLVAMIPTGLFISLVIDLFKIIKHKKIINDYTKMLLFIENENKINQNIVDHDNKFIKDMNQVFLHL